MQSIIIIRRRISVRFSGTALVYVSKSALLWEIYGLLRYGLEY